MYNNTLLSRYHEVLDKIAIQRSAFAKYVRIHQLSSPVADANKRM